MMATHLTDRTFKVRHSFQWRNSSMRSSNCHRIVCHWLEISDSNKQNKTNQTHFLCKWFISGFGQFYVRLFLLQKLKQLWNEIETVIIWWIVMWIRLKCLRFFGRQQFWICVMVVPWSVSSKFCAIFFAPIFEIDIPPLRHYVRFIMFHSLVIWVLQRLFTSLRGKNRFATLFCFVKCDINKHYTVEKVRATFFLKMVFHRAN